VKILAIETSCDETAMAVVECDKRNIKILAGTVASQIKIHRPYGGVVPSLAKREHLKNLPILFKKISTSNVVIFDRIAVTVGPGLEPALWTGVNFANDLSKKMKVPIVGINHLEGHIYSNWLEHKNIAFPAIVLLVSGGHTILLKMDGLKKWQKLGETRDDAVGEAFDKVAKMLGLPYPGGPEIEKLAMKILNRVQDDIQFPRPMLHSKNYDFSFSGLKTAVLYYLRDNPLPSLRGKAKQSLVAASFQQAAIDVLVKKTMRAVDEFDAKSVLLCGGVACNKALQEALRKEITPLNNDIGCPKDTQCRYYSFHVPELKYNTDNAVMIAAAACLGNHYPTDRAQANLSL